MNLRIQTSPPDGRVDMADLKRKSVRGGMVTLGCQGISIAIQLASTVILARLLTPDDYGTIAMVMAVTAFAGLFRDLGLSSAAIQKKDLTHVQQSNLFWLNVAMGTALTAVVSAASPLVAWFYGKPELTLVTIALSSSFLIGSFGTQHGARLVREMRFGRQAIARITGSLLALAVSVTLAWFGWSYWALVWGNLSGAVTTTLLLFVVSPFRPSLFKKGAGIREMLGFGAHITAFEFVNYFHRNLDNILIGRFWGTGALGLYSKAYQLLMLPIHTVRGPINAVAFPALSKLQKNPKDFRNYYCRITHVTAAGSMPIAACLFVVAEPLIAVALGERWLSAAAIFQILSIVAFIQPSSTLRGVVVMSLGQGRRYLSLGILQASFTSLGFCIGVLWGPTGVAISYVVSTYLVMPFMFRVAFRDAPVGFNDFIRAVRYPALAAALAALAAWLLLRYALPTTMHVAARLTLASAAFSAAYALALSATREGRSAFVLILNALPFPGSRRLLQTK